MSKKKIMNVKREQIESWADDWEDPILQLKIIKEMKDFEVKSIFKFSELKSAVLLEISNRRKLENGNIKKMLEEKKAQKEEERQLKEDEKLKKATEKIRAKEEERAKREAEKKQQQEQNKKKIEEEKAKPVKSIPPKDELKELLTEEQKQQEFEKYTANEINWIENNFYDSWDKCKGHWHNIIRPNSEEQFKIEETPKIEKWFIIANDKDIIEGKPQLVHDVQKKIPLIRLASKINSIRVKDFKLEWKTPKYIFFDQRYDKRYDGALIDSFSLDFWVYKVESNGKEYFVYSRKKLPDGKCKMTGMNIEIDDVCQMGETLKINSLSNMFLVKDAVPAVKVLPPKELLKLIVDKKLTLTKWLNHLSQHPYKTINNFPIEMELLRSSVLLSGKFDGYPMHLAVIGPQGTRKTMGHAETIYSKFDEPITMASATSYRFKGLTPSFRAAIAEPGYILQCNRVAVIDEIGKLIDRENNRHDIFATNLLGEWNDILEHKIRSGGSGNSFIDINPTAKIVLITNPCTNRPSLGSHVGLIDSTAMGRIVWWIQDKAEQEFVLGKWGLIRNPPEKQDKSSPDTLLSLYNTNNTKSEIVLGKCWGELVSKEEFLTIYDSCNSFVSKSDDDRIEKLVTSSLNLASEPMRSVWKPRAFHHVKLLVDGLTKMRCLFDEQTTNFEAAEIDYKWAERILIRMVKSWDTDLSPKQEGFR